MAGLMLNPQIINQDWGTALLNAATWLSTCSGINDLINDGVRLPRTGGQTSTDALVTAGLSAPSPRRIVRFSCHDAQP